MRQINGKFNRELSAYWYPICYSMVDRRMMAPHDGRLHSFGGVLRKVGKLSEDTAVADEHIFSKLTFGRCCYVVLVRNVTSYPVQGVAAPYPRRLAHRNRIAAGIINRHVCYEIVNIRYNN